MNGLRYNPNRNKERIETTLLNGKAPVSFGDVEAVRQKGRSKDGTQGADEHHPQKGHRLDGGEPHHLTATAVRHPVSRQILMSRAAYAGSSA